MIRYPGNFLQTFPGRLPTWGMILLLLSSVVLDQASKVWSERTLMKSSHGSDLRIYTGGQIPLVMVGEKSITPGVDTPYLYIGLSYVRNQGAAWGFLARADDRIRIPFFYFLAAIAVIVMSVYFWHTPHDELWVRYSLVLVLSGALGNLIDRLRLGYVIDWIDVRWCISNWNYRFPNFNLADSAITLGVAILLGDALFRNRRGGPAEKPVCSD